MLMGHHEPITGGFGHGFHLDRPELLNAYRTMRTIRTFEDRLHHEARDGHIPGFLHLSAGQEACEAGVIMHLAKSDWVASTHRGHGHGIAKGLGLSELAAEIFGRQTGYGRGKGGTMHVADHAAGFLGTNGIVGAGAPLICGAGLAANMKQQGSVGVCFIGDGASNQGTFLESLNLAAVWNLPVIYVVENNGYADSTSRDYAVAVDSYIDRAAGFGLPGVAVDGLDFFAVHEAAGEMIERARSGGGPGLLECSVVRMYGHYEGDTQTYRADGEVELIRRDHDCIQLFIDRVLSAGALSESELLGIDEHARQEVDQAIAYAKASPVPSASELTMHVYSDH
jgi:pyruvate dehydrogenase E1 component alpha subunit